MATFYRIRLGCVMLLTRGIPGLVLAMGNCRRNDSMVVTSVARLMSRQIIQPKGSAPHY